MADYVLNVTLNGVDQSVQTIGQLEQALKATNDELAKTDTNSDAFTQLQRQAVTLDGEMSKLTQDAKQFNSQLVSVDKTVDKLTSSIQDTAQASQQLGETTNINKLNQNITQTNNSSQSLRTELRKITQELQGLEVGSTRFQELSVRAGELRDTIGDTSAVVGALAGNATERLGTALGGVANIGITGLQAVTGGMQLLGVESESARAVLEKLQGLLFLTQSIKGFGALPDAIAQIKAGFSSLTSAREADLNVSEAQIAANSAESSTTVLNTAAQGTNTTSVGNNTTSKVANTAITEGQAVATKGATVAQNAMNVAMKAAPWALAIAGITLLITYWDDLTNSESEAEKAVREYSEEQKKVNKEIEQSTYKNLAQVSIAYNELRGAIEGANDVGQKQSWIKEALKDLPELSALTGEEADAAERVTEALRVRADLNSEEIKRKAIIEQISGLEAKIIESNDKGRQAREGLITLSNEEYTIMLNQSSAALKMINSIRKQLPAIEANIAGYRKERDEIVKNNETLEKQQEQEKEAAEEAKRLAEERRRAYKSAYDKIKGDVSSNLKLLNDLELNYIDELTKTSFKNKEEQVAFEKQLEQRKLDEIIKFRTEELAKSKVLGKERQKLVTQLETETLATQTALNNLYADKKAIAVAEDLKLEKDKAAQILLINQILQDEISFGDQDATDRKAQLNIRELQLQQNKADFEASINKMSLEDYKNYLNERKTRLEKINNAQKIIEESTAKDEAKRSLSNLADLLEKEGIITDKFNKNKVVTLKEFTNEETKEALKLLNEKEGVFTAEDEAYKILLQAKLNQDELYGIKSAEIEEKYRQQSKILNQETIDKEFQFRIEKAEEYFSVANEALQLFSNSQAAGFAAVIGSALTGLQEGFKVVNEDFAKLSEKVAAYAEVIANVVNSILQGFIAQNQANLDAELERLDIATSAEKDRITESYNASVEAEKAKYEQNLITQQQYNDSVETLNTQLTDDLEAQDKALNKSQLDEKKKAFKQDQNLKIAQTVVAGLNGAVQAFAGAMQLGPIAGPIVGAILAAAVGGLAAANIAQIKKVQFNSGQTISPVDPSLPDTGGAVAQASLPSGGGFTTFSEGAGSPGGLVPSTPFTGTPNDNQRVYVVESDITAAQNRVRVLEENSTFG